MTANTVAFGPVDADLDLPFAEGGIAWNRSLVFPGLRRGEHLENRIELAPRAPILAADGTPLAEGPADARAHPIGSAAIDVTGEVGNRRSSAPYRPSQRQGFAPYTPVGVNGLEKAFNSRLAGKPGRLAARRRPTPPERAAGPRPAAPEARRPGEDDDRPPPPGRRRLGAGRAGRAASPCSNARNGDVLRPRRRGLLRAPATRLDLQDHHHHRGAGKGRRLAQRRIPGHRRGQRRRALHQQRQRRVLRRHLPPGVRGVLQRRLRPARAEDRQRDAGRRRPNGSASTPPPPSTRRGSCGEVEPAEVERSRSRSATNSTSESARSGKAKCWRRRWRWRASRRRSPTAASASRPRSSANKKLRPDAKPVRVMSQEDRRRADRSDDRGGQGTAPGPPPRSPRARSPARPEPPSSAPSPASRTPPTRSSSRTPGSPPSSPPPSRGLRSACSLSTPKPPAAKSPRRRPRRCSPRASEGARRPPGCFDRPCILLACF